MLIRAGLAAALALGALPVAAVAGTAVVRSEVAGEADISGVGCGVAASTAVALPKTATNITVKRPRAGAGTNESRLTGVDVIGTSVRLTAVGAGPIACDPEEDPDVPPAERRWEGAYAYDIAFRRRVRVDYWAGAAVAHARPKARPRRLTVPDIATMVRLRWRTFGGRTAVGHGRLRCEIPGCVGRGDRFKVVLDHPSRCGDVGDTVYYGRIRFYATRTYKLIYPIRRGHLYSGGSPGCASTPVSRV